MTLNLDDHFTPIARPTCSTCGAGMWLTNVKPEKAYYDKRTFTCPRCDSIKMAVIRYDH